MKICVYGASSSIIDQSYILGGELIGKKLALNGHSIVYGGGAEGMMGAVARGVHSENGKIIGIAPSFLRWMEFYMNTALSLSTPKQCAKEKN